MGPEQENAKLTQNEGVVRGLERKVRVGGCKGGGSRERGSGRAGQRGVGGPGGGPEGGSGRRPRNLENPEKPKNTLCFMLFYDFL